MPTPFLSKTLFAAVFTAAISATSIMAIAPALADEITTYAPDGVAIHGTDPVAYFTMGKPVAGSDKFTATHDGVTWKFSTAENRDAFVATPTKYAPAYGGYCATGTSFGQKVVTAPEHWKIVDGKLYLNSSPGAHTRFLDNTASTITNANANWPKIKNVASN